MAFEFSFRRKFDNQSSETSNQREAIKTIDVLGDFAVCPILIEIMILTYVKLGIKQQFASMICKEIVPVKIGYRLAPVK